ncbi:AAA family ATPase [candidate division KSB1 bacterium]
MALLDEILYWTESLPMWQRDAVRRLFQQEGRLSKEDYMELYTLLKASHGLPNPESLMPNPFKAAHIPTVTQQGETVILKMIRDLKDVNCIDPQQKLSFAKTGMSAIYGGNSSGKSGYTRVLKRACRARDQTEKIHPNAKDPDAYYRVPEATFDIEIGGMHKPVHWTSNEDPPPELASISVFDSHCARAILTEEQDVAYLPYGLDVVENLANIVLPELASMLNTGIAGIDIDLQPYEHLIGETEAGRIIAALSENTDPAKIKALGTLSESELERISDINQALAESDPIAKARDLKLSAKRLKELTKRIDAALDLVTDGAIKNLKEIDDSAINANKEEKRAAEILKSGEILLPGTGEEVWKSLFEAARKFSTEFAYPEHKFPYTANDAVCPLCQQPLGNAGERLERFEEYINKNIAKIAEKQRQHVQTAMFKIERADLNFALDESLTGELEHLDQKIVSIIKVFHESIESRRTWILDAFNSHYWDNVPILSENPRQKLRNLAARQYRAARTFDRAADTTKRKALETEHKELRARENLSKCLNGVLSLIERMSNKKNLENCKRDLNTKPISDKSKEFSSKAVTEALKQALDVEFEALGIGHIKTKLKKRSEKGKIKHQLLLDLPTSHKLEEILSEGEQRAIALGSFLAELELANHSGGIVFDDPVSSLDHKRRGKLAKRLVLESQQRQVLVFTHEVVFLHQLCDECEKLSIPLSLCFLEMIGPYSGIVAEGLPWKHKSYGERIDKLEKKQRELARLPWPPEPSEELANKIIQQYSFLRATIERVVQDLVLNATVQRFRDYINVKSLEKVVGLEKAEVDEIIRLNQRCNDVVEAHDPASAKDEPPPEPSELKQDIEDLKRVVQRIKDRRSN